MEKSYPILEFDDDKSAVLEPQMMTRKIGAPENCVLCFFPKAIENILKEYPHKKIGMLPSEDIAFPVYEIEYNNMKLCLCQARVGGPCAASQMEELHVMGCRKFMVCGSCGVLRDDLTAGHLIVPDSAVRDEGTSYHYLPPSREISLDLDIVSIIENTLSGNGIPYVTGKTWTTDAVYRETRKKVNTRKEEGCISVEMECATLAAVSKFHNISFGQILYAGDMLEGDEWDSRGFLKLHDVRDKVLQIALSICAKI